MTLRAFVLQPEIVFQAEVALNPPASSYPIDELTFDNVTVGAFADIEVGQLITLGTASLPSNHGTQRIRKPATADTIYIGRTSQGFGYGEVNPIGTSRITVWDLRMVWGKPYFEDIDAVASPPTRVHFKDGDIAYSDQTSAPPPVSNCGPGTMATIDGSNIITVEFPAGGVNDSFAVADGATISTYLWDVGDGTIIVGTSASAVITATFPAGFRYVSLTVTDSNGKTHTAYCPVFARDPASDDTIPIDGLTIRRGQEGQEATVELTRALPEATYPDNTLVMLADGEPSGASDHSHMEFIGFHHRDAAEHRAERTGYITGARLTCLDVAGKMQLVHGFSQEISHAATPAHWGEMATANMDKFMHYLLQWHSNALELADWTWSGTGATYALYRRGANPGTLWDQVKAQGEEMNPTYRLTCNSLGQLAVIVDPMIEDSGVRTAIVQTAINESEWSAVRYDRERYPRYFWLWGGAVIAGNTLNAEGELDTAFCVAPGEAPGVGYTEMRDEVGITPNQSVLNYSYGHRYARMNAPERPLRVDLTGGNDHGIEPANMTWVQLTVGEDMPAAPRGLVLSAERGLPLELALRWNVTRTGVVKSAQMTWERETVGADAVTQLPQENADEVETGLPDGYVDFSPGDIAPPPQFYGNPQMYVLWDGLHLMRTNNIMDSSPVWELVDTGITGNIQDAQYVIVDSSTVGLWLMSTDGIWWCADIMATTPSWSNVLPIATIRAADAVPVDGQVVCKCMANAAVEPGYLIVATGPLSGDISNLNYKHAYFWHTHDYGQNWTQVDMNMFTFGTGTEERGYFFSSVYAMEILRSEPATIYCIRSTPREVFDFDSAVFKSVDLGHTWTQEATTAKLYSQFMQQYSLLHPHPSAADAGYVLSGSSTLRTQKLQRSTDEFASLLVITDDDIPTGYDSISSFWRVNSRSDDPDHVIAWFWHIDTSIYHLLESYDRGDTWSVLYTGGNVTNSSIPNTGTGGSDGAASGAIMNTPNVWPGDASGQTWFLIRAPGSDFTTPRVRITTDNFATVQDRTGNLSTLLSGVWTSAPASGVSLPKIGANS